jgi:ABC-type transporter Mla MlaB component
MGKIMESVSLHSRLRNCLLTILELEGTLTATHLEPVLRDDFAVLKKILQRLENVQTDESDVCRIEAATSKFLAELKETFDKVKPPLFSTTRLLQ